jgi:glycosyltransferase involved in cell wall biosynthesis
MCRRFSLFMPTVSIIIPVYKYAHLLTNALDSCMAQTYRDFEVVIVDDGSPDDVKSIVDRYMDQLPSLRYLRQENQGVSGARNTGVAHAQGAFLNFLDHDDQIKPDMLSRCMEQFERDPQLMVVYTNWELRSADLSQVISTKFNAVPPEQVFDWLSRSLSVSQLNTAVIRKELFQRVGGFWHGISGVEDWMLWFTFYAYKAPMHYIPERLAVYRRHSGNTSGDQIFMQRQMIKAWEYVRKLDVRVNVDEKISELYNDVAYRLWSNEQRPEAREAYRAAIRYNGIAKGTLTGTLKLSFKLSVKLWIKLLLSYLFTGKQIQRIVRP